MQVSCLPSLPTLWQPPRVYPLLGISSECRAQQETVGHFGRPSKMLTLRNYFREGISKITMENSQSGNTRSKFILKREKSSSKKGKRTLFLLTSSLNRTPHGKCAGDAAVAAALCAPNQGKGFRQLLGHSEHRGPGGFRDIKH